MSLTTFCFAIEVEKRRGDGRRAADRRAGAVLLRNDILCILWDDVYGVRCSWFGACVLGIRFVVWGVNYCLVDEF